MATRPVLSSRLRWAVPAAVAGAVTAAVTLPGAFAAAGSPDLPERTAAELLADLGTSEVTALSGTVVQTSRLGFPELPEVAGAPAGGTGPMALLSGSNTIRVWYDGPERARVALLGDLAEYTVVRDGDEAWTYSSEKNEAVRYALPEHGGDLSAPGAPATPPTPADAAEAALAAIDPSTEVRVERTARVADRDAYQLVLDPRDDRSLVASIRVAIDAETSAPLRVQVWSSQDTVTPALEVGFTDVSFERPEASVFDFTAPAGAEVREVEAPVDGAAPGDGPDGSAGPGRAGAAERADRLGAPAGEVGAVAPPGTGPVEVVGSGWTSVLTMSGVDTAALASGENAAMLDQLTTRVPEGRLLSTALLTVLITDDGRVLAGAVPADLLRETAAR